MNRPRMLTDTRFHRRSNPEGLVNPAKVVVHVKQSDHCDVVLDLLAEGVCQPGEAPHVHSHVEILPFHVAGARSEEQTCALPICACETERSLRRGSRSSC